MREIRQSGSEGGEITKVIFPTPIVALSRSERIATNRCIAILRRVRTGYTTFDSDGVRRYIVHSSIGFAPSDS